MTVTSRLGLTLLVTGQSGAEALVNDMITAFDALFSGSINSSTTTAQPASPSNGDAYLLIGTPSGAAWTGQQHKLAVYYDGWRFFSVSEGQRLYDRENNYLIEVRASNVYVLASSSNSLNARRDADGTTSDKGASLSIASGGETELYGHEDAATKIYAKNEERVRIGPGVEGEIELRAGDDSTLLNQKIFGVRSTSTGAALIDLSSVPSGTSQPVSVSAGELWINTSDKTLRIGT